MHELELIVLRRFRIVPRASAPMVVIYEQLSLAQLRARLRRRSIPFAGLKGKQQLINRLRAADAQRNPTSVSSLHRVGATPSTIRPSLRDTINNDWLATFMLFVLCIYLIGSTLLFLQYNFYFKVASSRCQQSSGEDFLLATANDSKQASALTVPISNLGLTSILSPSFSHVQSVSAEILHLARLPRSL